MAFELAEPTTVAITNANPRRELHGEEKVRAIDLSFTLTGENTLLDLIEPGLREHHYCNNALKDGQDPLPGVVIPLPNLRHPQLPLIYHYGKGQKWRGYHFIWDWGIDENHVDFTDAVLSGLQYELSEGGSVTIKGTISYNGEELQDNDLFGELSGLAAEGEISIKLLAPAELVQAKKGYRAGKPDTPPARDSGSGELDFDDDDEDSEEEGDGEERTPESAFADSVLGDQQ
ncbi:hypothetical protein [Comamonas terrae]|uniref:Uncharacterized protein n=1 Tax=Comamonas terrae TaxID=673548 RepID=A0ABW5UQS8_9BURK|nr:hypothetical protein [Comamonas terrae]